MDESDALKKLKAQQDKLAAKIQLLENREKAQAKKNDTRRKILVGAYYLEKAEKENSYPALQEAMKNFLTRPSDKILFGINKQQGPSDENS